MTRHATLVVAGVVAVLALPHLLLGPDLVADDWVWVRNGVFGPAWDVGRPRLESRPGQLVVYAGVFGLGDARPLLHSTLVLVAWLGAAVAVHAALRRLLDGRTALGCTLLWLLAPSHVSLELWTSAIQGSVAVASLGAGTALLTGRRRRAGWALLVAAGTFYEVVVPVVPVAALAADRVRTGRWRAGAAVAGVAAAVPAAAWSVWQSSAYDASVPTTGDRWYQHLAAPLALGLDVGHDVVAASVLAATAVAAAAIGRRALAQRATRLDGAALVGLAVVVLGAAPGVRSYTIPVGIGDRLTAASGIGAAVFWWCAVAPRLTSQGVDRRVRVAVVAAGLALATTLRLDAVAEWSRLGDRAADRARDLAARARPGDALVVDGPLLDGDGFYGLYDGWNTTAAVQVVAADPRLVVQVDIGCARTGPLATNPLEQDGERGPLPVPGC